MSRESVDVVLKGYRAFIDGDLDTVAELLHDDVEWSGIQEGPWDCADRAEVLRMIAQRLGDHDRVTLDRCIGIGDRVVVHFRASRTDADRSDDRPLQTRRSYTIGRYSGVVTIADGRVVRIQDYPHVGAALEAVGLQAEFS